MQISMIKLGVRKWFGIALGLACLADSAVGTTWTNSAGDLNWSTAANWSSGVPGPGDSVVFNANATGINIVDSDRTVNRIDYVSFINGTGVYETRIGSGITLTVQSALYIGFDDIHGFSPTGQVDVTGSGTLRVGGTMYVGGRSSGAGYPSGTLRLNGVRFLADNLNILRIGPNDHQGNTATGVLDLSLASGVQSGSAVNSLVVNNNLEVGYWNGVGSLILPPTVTNISCGFLGMGIDYQGYSDRSYGLIDLGTNPALVSLNIAGDAMIPRGRFIYNDGTSGKTGFPPNVSVRIGTSSAPSSLQLASAYATQTDVRWGGFRRFEAWLRQLYLGYASNSQIQYGELDLTDTNTIELTGSFTSGRMSVGDVRLGSQDSTGSGRLKLPSSMTNITVGTLYLGYAGTISFSPDYSVIDLGSNSALRELVISNEFRMGRGQFQYVDAIGNTVTGTPAGLSVRIGSPAVRASTFYIGDAVIQGSQTRFGSGVTDFSMYVTNANVARGFGGNHWSLGQLDLSQATNLVFDVQNTFQISDADESYGYVFLAGGAEGGRGCASNLFISNPIRAWAAQMVLSNVQFAVSNQMAIRSPGQFTNYVCGLASGIDLQTTNLTIVDGRTMHLVFQADPVNSGRACWGLRMKGDAIAQINALTSAPAKVTYDISGLSDKYKARFGVFYDGKTDRTYLGVRDVPQSTLFIIR